MAVVTAAAIGGTAITGSTIAAGVATAATTYSAIQGSRNSGGGAGYQGGPMGPVPQLSAAQSRSVFGEKVEPVDYTPLAETDPGYRISAARVISGNLKNLPGQTKLSNATNLAISKAAKTRGEGWDPTMMASLSQLYQNRNNMLAGNIPYADAMEAMAGRNRQANDIGNAGGAGHQSAADLGLARMDVMNQGAQLAGTIQQILQGIDPLSRHTTPQNYQLDVGKGVEMNIMDAQFGAQFQAQQNAVRAMADPAAAGLYNQQMFMAGMNNQRGAMPPQGGTNWGQVAGVVGQVAGAFAGGYQPNRGSAAGYSTGQAASPYPGGVNQGYNYNPNVPATYAPHNLSARPAGA